MTKKSLIEGKSWKQADKLIEKFSYVDHDEGIKLFNKIINKKKHDDVIIRILRNLASNQKKYTWKIIDHIFNNSKFDYDKEIINRGNISHLAALNGNIYLLKYLIKNNLLNTELNKLGLNPFTLAIVVAEFTSSFEAVKLLFKSGKFKINSKNKSGYTPLYLACSSSYSDMNYTTKIIKFLLENGANPNIKDKYGNTPMMIIMDRYISPFRMTPFDLRFVKKTIDLLIKHGADINLKNSIGETALMVASTFCDDKNKIKVIKHLIDNGANIYLKDKQNKTVLEKYSTGECSKFIRKYKNIN